MWHRVCGPGRAGIKKGTSPRCSPWPKTYNYRKSRGSINSSFMTKYGHFYEWATLWHRVCGPMGGGRSKRTSPRCSPWPKTSKYRKSRGSNKSCFMTKYGNFCDNGPLCGTAYMAQGGPGLKKKHHHVVRHGRKPTTIENQEDQIILVL